jgi:putative membrane protein
MNRKKWITMGLSAGLLWSVAPAFASGTPAPAAQTQPANPAMDADFLLHARGVNQFELVLGEMASRRAATSEVKEMAAKMLQKHTGIGRQLQELAQLPPASAPPALAEDQEATVARLSTLPDGDFDKSFKEAVGAVHVRELALYRDEASRTQSASLRTFTGGRISALEQSMGIAPQAARTPRAKRGW